MLTLYEEEGLLYICAGGQLSPADYDAFEAAFDCAVPKGAENVPMLIELQPDFSGWNLGALWRELNFDVRRYKAFGRIAVLGESSWEKWGTKLTDPLFPSAEMRFFESTDRAEAVRWALRGEAR